MWVSDLLKIQLSTGHVQVLLMTQLSTGHVQVLLMIQLSTGHVQVLLMTQLCTGHVQVLLMTQLSIGHVQVLLFRVGGYFIVAGLSLCLQAFVVVNQSPTMILFLQVNGVNISWMWTRGEGGNGYGLGGCAGAGGRTREAVVVD